MTDFFDDHNKMDGIDLSPSEQKNLEFLQNDDQKISSATPNEKQLEPNDKVKTDDEWFDAMFFFRKNS
jgi:hypothetical protein